jgi:PAS domain-containing protein
MTGPRRGSTLSFRGPRPCHPELGAGSGWGCGRSGVSHSPAGRQRALDRQPHFPVHDSEGKLCRVVGFAEDITERKQTELRLWRKTEELETIFQSLPDLYFRIHRNGTILDYLSDSRRKLYVPPEQFLDKRM